MRNIIITGGGMVNKGAQAMTLITVSELHRRYPDHHIYLYAPSDVANPEIRKDSWKFDFLGWSPLKFAQCQSNVVQRLMICLRHGKELAEAEEVYRNTDMLIDISGYALGSNWSDKICNDYLDILEFAKGFHIPVYLMPQSFGPFDFGEDRKALDQRIRRLLPTAKLIFAREQDGYDALVRGYGLKNVRLAGDLVLNNRGIDLTAVYKTLPKLDIPAVEEESVGIIPNSRNNDIGDKETVFLLYDSVIRELLNMGKAVYLLSHSTMDAALCRGIKERFYDENNVVLLDQNFSCLEFNELVQKFRFLIASRFHSIVHAYKNGIPCVTLGWAVKYHDLMALFGQEEYMFDVRGAVNTDKLLAAVHYMDVHWKEESKKIRNQLESAQKENVFDTLPQL